MVRFMDESIQISFMQARIVRMFSERMGISIAEGTEIFDQNGVFKFIRDCFGIFHTEGDEAVYNEVIMLLKNRGVINDQI